MCFYFQVNSIEIQMRLPKSLSDAISTLEPATISLQDILSHALHIGPALGVAEVGRKGFNQS